MRSVSEAPPLTKPCLEHFSARKMVGEPFARPTEAENVRQKARRAALDRHRRNRSGKSQGNRVPNDDASQPATIPRFSMLNGSAKQTSNASEQRNQIKHFHLETWARLCFQSNPLASNAQL